MSIATDLVAYLLAQSSITTLVGTRIWGGQRREQGSALPAITVHVISAGQEVNLTARGGTAFPRIQIDVWGATYATADAVKEAIRLKLQGFSGTMGSSTVTTVLYEGSLDLFEKPVDGSDASGSVEHMALNYRIRHRQTKPTYA